jgi:hypothetical protein
MKIIKLISGGIFLILAATGASFGQDKKAAEKPPIKKESKPLLYKVCNPPVDTDNTHQVTLADAIAWSQSQPLEVLCDGKYTVELYQFQIQIISMDPLTTNDFGMGEGGMPILAINAIKSAKPGDTIFLKNVTFKDRSSREVLKAPNIVFTLK